MKDFEITVSLKDNELLIVADHAKEVKSYVENENAVLRCIKNYIEMYVWNEKGGKKMKKEFKIIDWVEQNPFVDPTRSNNGGGYSQPRIDFTYKGKKGFINDSSCGEFGERLEIVYGDKVYYCDFVSQKNLEYSDFSKYKHNDRQAVKEIRNQTGYKIYFKEEL
jgi:hypothetical protein